MFPVSLKHDAHDKKQLPATETERYRCGYALLENETDHQTEQKVCRTIWAFFIVLKKQKNCIL